MSVAFLFPGQGAQSAGFLHRLPEHREVRRTLDEASAILDCDVTSLDAAGRLASTVAVQVSLLTAGVAAARALIAEGVRPSVVAGMSIGAFGAAVTCGTLSFADALRVARFRGERMEAAFPSGYGLAALEGLNEREVEAMLQRLRRGEGRAYVSNVNGPRQIVIAGSSSALDAVMAVARHAGASRVERLAVGVPSHTPLMQPIAEALTEALSSLRLEAPSVPYISNRGGRPLYDAEAIREDLATSVAHRVRWYEALEVIHELGASLFLEVPPGHVSTRLVARLLPEVRALSVDERGLRDATALGVTSLASSYYSLYR